MTPPGPDFWQRLDALVADCGWVIDRPQGSPHPRYPATLYPLDYGYLPGTTASDGGGIDAWRGSLPAPQLTGLICTFDPLKKDAEIKLLVGCTPAECETILAFHTEGGQAALFIPRA